MHLLTFRIFQGYLILIEVIYICYKGKYNKNTLHYIDVNHATYKSEGFIHFKDIYRINSFINYSKFWFKMVG